MPKKGGGGGGGEECSGPQKNSGIILDLEKYWCN